MDSSGLVNRLNRSSGTASSSVTSQQPPPQRTKAEELSQDEEMEPLPSNPSGETMPQDSGKIEALDSALKDIPVKWKNWITRGIFTVVMISGFCFVVYLGPLALTLLILAIQFKCFHEIITIGYVVYKSHYLPWFRTLSWYFLITSNYYFYGESLIEKFGILLKRDDFLTYFVKYHRFISFSLYTAGFVAFVVSLKKTYYLKQFTLFGYTHLALLIIVTQSNLMVQNIFEGLIWFLLPVSLIICNDIMAYIFGFFFGRTRLIKLSPKKTWEGFIGGAIATIIFGFLFSAFFVNYKLMVCPLEYDDTSESVLNDNCTLNRVFQQKIYNVPKPFSLITSKIQLEPFLLHTFSLSLFASTIGPFGGFFASGFKRAFKIKDFGDTIPGHGGFMDRFDCQVIMATFVNVYIHSFIRGPSPNKLLNQVLTLNFDDQQEFLRLFYNHFNSSRNL